MLYVVLMLDTKAVGGPGHSEDCFDIIDLLLITVARGWWGF